MDKQGFDRIVSTASSFAEERGIKISVEGLPEQGPPYNGVSVQMEVDSVPDASEKQLGLRKALGEAGLLYAEAEGSAPSNSPALKLWEVGIGVDEFVDMSTEHGRFMDTVYTTR